MAETLASPPRGAAGRALSKICSFFIWLWSGVTSEIKPIHIVLAAVVLLIGSVLGWYVYKQATKDVVIIDTITVPKRYEELGFDSSVMTLRIAEELQNVEQEIDSRAKRVNLIPKGDTSVPDIEVPEAKVSLKTLVEAVQQALHREPLRVKGEITFPWATSTANSNEKAPVMFRYHVYRGPKFLYTGAQAVNSSNPEDIARPCAERLLAQLNPYLWAVYVTTKQKDLPGALAIARSILSGNSDNKSKADAHVLVGTICAMREDVREAATHFQKATELNPRNAVAYNNWGLLIEDSNHEKAIQLFRKAASIDPNYALAFYNWGVELYTETKFRECVPKLQRAITLDPAHERAYQGLILDAEGKEEEAIATLEAAITANAQDAIAFYHWGLIIDRRGNHEKAVEKYRRAKEIDPTMSVPVN